MSTSNFEKFNIFKVWTKTSLEQPSNYNAEIRKNILEQNPVRFDRQRKSTDLSNCPLPINNIIDLTTLEDKISGDQDFKNQLVS